METEITRLAEMLTLLSKRLIVRYKEDGNTYQIARVRTDGMVELAPPTQDLPSIPNRNWRVVSPGDIIMPKDE